MLCENSDLISCKFLKLVLFNGNLGKMARKRSVGHVVCHLFFHACRGLCFGCFDDDDDGAVVARVTVLQIIAALN